MRRSSILAVVIALSVMITACSPSPQAVPLEQSQHGMMPSEMQQPVVNEMPMDQMMKDEKSEMMMTDKKPVQMQMHDTMMQLIADGTYSDIVAYRIHSGIEHVNVTVSIENDVVTDISVAGVQQSRRVSKNYINGVNAALPTLVVGKRIDEIDLPAQISGSSLTTAAVEGYLNGLVNL